MTPKRWLLVGAAGAIAVVGFLLFRPDTLFTEVRTDDALEDAFEATTTTEAGEEEPATVVAGSSPTTSTTAAPATTVASVGPVEVAGGEFTGIDHSATGTAHVYEQDGRYVLRFEDDTDIQNGPDLYVWVLAAGSYDGGTPGEYIDLGTLKGTIGGQNYQLPPEFDPAVHRTVLVWCLRFAVPFAAAPLS